MKKTYILTLVSCIFITFGEAQDKETYFHVGNDSKIISIGEKYSKSEINFSSVKPAAIGGGAVGSFLVTKIILPIIFDNISTLFYNPDKYIKENNAAYSFIDFNSYKIKTPLNSHQAFSFIKTIYDSKTGNVLNNPKKAIEATFNLRHISNGNQKMTILELNSFDYNFTSVKLKSKGKKVNLIFEITVNYINTLNEVKTLNLQPVNLNRLSPNGSKNTNLSKDKIHLVLQNLYFIQSISMKVTEVNSRKKDMDKWLELYTKNKDKIQSFTIDQLN